jgi:hypothetical protein
MAPMTDAPKLDKIYTAEEAAERLRMTKRAVIRLGRAHGFYSQDRRNFFFSEADLLGIWQAIRKEPREPRRAVHVRLGGPEAAWKRLRELCQTKPPGKSDKRELEILAWLAEQRVPKTYKQIERAGEKTIEQLLRFGLVEQTGEDANGLKLVRISKEGRNEVRAADRWYEKRPQERQYAPPRWRNPA